MPEGPDTLEVLVRVATEAEASLITQLLADQGISAKAVGAFTAGFNAEAPGDVSVLVTRGDLTRAKSLLAAVRQDSVARQLSENEADPSARRAQDRSEEEVAFLCEECGQTVVFSAERCGYVEVCPNCGSYVDVPDTASRPGLEARKLPEKSGVGPRTLAQLWCEVLAVLCLAYIPDLFAAIGIAIGWFPAERPFVPRMLLLTIRSLGVAMPLLMIVALSKDPWPLFGIVRPRWIVDGLGGCAICLVGLLGYCVIMSLLPPSMLQSSTLPRHAHRAMPEGMATFFLALVAQCANALAEELVMRGYLIARLERLLRSTWQAVLVATVLFASYHLYQGPAGVVGAAVTGLVLAVSFCLFRRIWPLCVAHALLNLLPL